MSVSCEWLCARACVGVALCGCAGVGVWHMMVVQGRGQVAPWSTPHLTALQHLAFSVSRALPSSASVTTHIVVHGKPWPWVPKQEQPNGRLG